MTAHKYDGDSARHMLNLLPRGIQSAMKLLMMSLKHQLPPSSGIGMIPVRDPENHADKGVLLCVVDPLDPENPPHHLPEELVARLLAEGKTELVTPLCMFKESITDWDHYESDPDSPLNQALTDSPATEPAKKPRFNFPSEN